MTAKDGRHGVIGPHVPQAGIVESLKLGGIALIRAGVGMSISIGSLSGCIHGEGGITAARPIGGPFFERAAAASMHEEHAGDALSRLQACGSSEPGKDAGGPPLQRFAFIPDFLNQSVGGAPFMGWWRGQQFLGWPWAGWRRGAGVGGRSRSQSEDEGDEEGGDAAFHEWG